MSILKFRRSIFTRFVIAFLIIIIPIYALGIYIYNWGRATVFKEISNATTNQMSFYLSRLEQEIERIKILQYDCLNDTALNSLSVLGNVMNSYERIQNMNQLRQRLATIKNSSAYIKDVEVHIANMNKTISATTGVSTLDSEKFQRIRVSANLTGAQMIYYKNDIYLTTMRIEGSYTPNFSVEIQLDKAAFSQALEQFIVYPESAAYLYNTNFGTLLVDLPPDQTITNSHTRHMINTKIVTGEQSKNMQQDHYFVVHTASSYLQMVLINYIPQQYVLNPLQHLYTWLWLFSAVTIVVVLMFSLFVHHVIHRPIMKLVKSFQEVENGNLTVSIHSEGKDEFGFLFHSFNKMVAHINNLIHQVYHQKILAQKAELKQLQSQINPHFLYNSFFIINTMARTEDENLIPFTKQLGEYFRFITRNSSDTIPLKDEIYHARIYSEIQQMRFPSKLTILFELCQDRFSTLQVPRLILQPIIENAFEHGFRTQKNKSIIWVHFEDDASFLYLTVEDNGLDLTAEKIDEIQNYINDKSQNLEITGLRNIHQRIQLFFGEESFLSVSQSTYGGLKVTLKIKLPGV